MSGTNQKEEAMSNERRRLLTDEMVERARLAQGRMTLGGKYRDSQDPEDIDTALFYAIPPEEMRAALTAALAQPTTGVRHES